MSESRPHEFKLVLDSNLNKIHHNMLVLQHNRFRNSPSIINNNFGCCSLIKALSKHYVLANTKKHCAHPWHVYMTVKIRSINCINCMKSTQFLSLSVNTFKYKSKSVA